MKQNFSFWVNWDHHHFGEKGSVCLTVCLSVVCGVLVLVKVYVCLSVVTVFVWELSVCLSECCVCVCVSKSDCLSIHPSVCSFIHIYVCLCSSISCWFVYKFSLSKFFPGLTVSRCFIYKCSHSKFFSLTFSLSLFL